jgi:hypothetical protein
MTNEIIRVWQIEVKFLLEAADTIGRPAGQDGLSLIGHCRGL